MMDWDDHGKLGVSISDDLNGSSATSVVSDGDRDASSAPASPSNLYSKPSMRGLQHALAQGWLVQRARDMCSFTHDRYRQAATHMAGQLPDIVVMRMCLRVAFSLMQVRRCLVSQQHSNDLLQEEDKEKRDVYRIAEYSRRCIPLIREHPNREEFVDCLVSAAEASAARGAHEVCPVMLDLRSFS